MNDLVRQGALLCTGAGVFCGLLALGRTRDIHLALQVLLDLLLAAGLLRLSLPPTPNSLLTAAALLLVRRVINLGLRQNVRVATVKSDA